MAKLKVESKEPSLLPDRYEAYSMVQTKDHRYAIIRTTVVQGKILGEEILSTESERQFAQERFKIITYQEGMSDR